MMIHSLKNIGSYLSLSISLSLLHTLLFSTVIAQSKVTISYSNDHASLLVNGAPFEIKGVGGNQQLKLLKKSGANAIRTWGVDEVTLAKLDLAHQHGIRVAIGYWLGHERHGFDYTNGAACEQQATKLFNAVRKFKHHPAVLLWGIGNEMEGFQNNTNPAIYHHIEYLARKVKEIDPHHPTMTVTAEIGRGQVQALNEFCPSIDIHGINAYAGTHSLPRRYREQGGKKPYILSEYGPRGFWESPKNKWGASIEPTSNEKATHYAQSYQSVHSDPLCLGSFAFVWGAKQEASATWFGMLLPSGEKLNCVDTLTELWSGKPSPNLCPCIHELDLLGCGRLLEQGEVIYLKLKASDPENDALQVQWVLTEDWLNTAAGGDTNLIPPSYPSAILEKSDSTTGIIKLPHSGGTYRVYAYVYDGKGSAAVGNISIKVKGKRKRIPTKAAIAKLPLLLTDTNKNAPYTPSGWMGDTQHLSLNERSTATTTAPHQGKHCMELSYKGTTGWAGIVWQHPANDWGDKPGGLNLTGAKRLTIWAKGKAGGEKVKFGLGLIKKDKPYHDTAHLAKTITLSTQWEQYTIDLNGQDLSRIKSGLHLTLAATGQPFTLYFDGITIE